jgi:hypothetical protein
MSNLPFWAYSAITFGGLTATAGIVYLIAISKRNWPPKKDASPDVVMLDLGGGAHMGIPISPYEAAQLRRVSRNARTYDVHPSA